MRIFPKKHGGHVFSAPPRGRWDPDPTDDLYKLRRRIELGEKLVKETKKNHGWD